MTNVASNIAKVTKKNSSFLCQINCRYSVKVRGLKLGIVDSLAFPQAVADSSCTTAAMGTNCAEAVPVGCHLSVRGVTYTTLALPHVT